MVVSQKLGLLSLSLLVDGMGIGSVPGRQSETISCALSTSIALKSTPILKKYGTNVTDKPISPMTQQTIVKVLNTYHYRYALIGKGVPLL